MLITTKKTINIFDYNDVWEHQYQTYHGDVDLLKGSNSQAEQQAADAQRAQENATANAQLALQQGQLSAVNAAVDPTIQSILQGQTPGVLSGLENSLTASYMNQLPATFANAQGAINNSLVARGVTGGQQGAGGGAIGQNYGQLAAMMGALQQQGATNTALTMNAQKLGLLQNDLGLKMGIANQYGSNFGNANNAAIGSLNAGVTAANNADQAQTSWMGPVIGGLTGLAGRATYSSSGGFGFGGCWIAKECYGSWSDIRVQFIRMRLWKRAEKEFKFKALVVVYMITGKLIARLVNKYASVKRFFTSICEKFIQNECDVVLNESLNG
jgi:hypothetical protein